MPQSAYNQPSHGPRVTKANFGFRGVHVNINTGRIQIDEQTSRWKTDLGKAEAIIRDVVFNDPRSLSDPEPFLQVNNLGDFSVDFLVRCWVPASEFFQYQADMKRKVKEAFDAGGIDIPFPTQTVYRHDA